MKNYYNKPIFPAGDPFILAYQDKYYLYATTENSRELEAANAFDTDIDGNDGIQVYESSDLVNWQNRGFCLKKEDVIGERWFWAPEVTYHNGKFYMVYSSEEHPAIAISDSPLGPFRQTEKKWLRKDKSIDGHIFIDDDGTAYLYYVRLDEGNRIFVARLSDSLTEIAEEYEQCLISANEPWETIDCNVAEGPFVLKHNGTYYLIYSCNHTRSKDYAVGYATSDSPLGPFEKYSANPILHKNGEIAGTGHNSFFYDLSRKQLLCAYHCHNNSSDNFKPRKFCFTTATFITAENGIDILACYL